MELSFANLWQLLPQVTNVSYTSIDNSTYTIPYVCTTPRKICEAKPSWGRYKMWATTIKIDPAVWHAATSNNLYPKSRDLFKIGNITWQVDSDVDTSHLDSVYRLSANYLEFQLQLKDSVRYVSSSSTTSASGARIVSDSYSNAIAAAIEPEDASIKDAFGALTSPATYMVYLDEDPSGTYPTQFKVGDMLIDQSNNLYEIEEVMDRERLDLKPSFKCVRKLNG